MKRIKIFFIPLALWYLRSIAYLALSHTRATVIGIAGSVGKTSTREALFAVLKDVAPTHMVAGNSETGVPLGLVGLFPSDYSPLDWMRMFVTAPFRIFFLKHIRYVIVEMGIDDPYPPKNMEYLLTIIKPDIGVITEESAAHTMQFEKLLKPAIIADNDRLNMLIEAITKEDAKMIRQEKCTVGIVNGDNPFLTNELPDALTFGTKKSSAIHLTDYSVSIKQTTFSFILGNDPIDLQFKGYAFPKDMAYVFAPAILTAHTLNIPTDTIRKNLQKNFMPPKGRESLFEGINNTIILDSSYNASKESDLSFLDLVRQLKTDTKRHAIVVLADMLELGNESQIEHEAVAKAVAPVADTLYLVGPLTKRFILPVIEKSNVKPTTIEWFPSITELNEKLANVPKNSLILFKGSQGNLWLEESIKLLLKNNEDVSRLCRQNAFWKKVKTTANRWVEM